MIKKFLYLLCLVTVFGCSDDVANKYPEYKRTESGLYMKILRLGEGDVNPEVGSVITVSMTYSNMADSLFYQDEMTYKVTPPAFSGSFEEGILTMHEGDSVSFIVSADSIFSIMMQVDLPAFLDSGTDMRIEMKLLAIHSEKDFTMDVQAYAEWLDTADLDELEMIMNYLEKNELKVKPTDRGLFFLEKVRSEGVRAAFGKQVVVRYSGEFLDGTKFDSTEENGEDFEFVLGNDDQVIDGVEMTLETMRQGEKIRVLLPSFLAFGQKGSSTGMVPPFTPVIYNIELIKVY